MRSYLSLALKVLTRRKFFTFISLFGITLTLVVLVVAVAILDDVFAPKQPESRFDRVLVMYRISLQGPEMSSTANPGYGFVHDFVAPLAGAERVSAFSQPQETAVYTGGGRIDTYVKRTDANYWQILDFRFLEGRGFSADEEERGAPVAVITEEMRQKLFAGANAVGKTLNIDGRAFRIIGVVPSVPLSRASAFSEVWVPVTTSKSSDYRHQFLGGFNGLVLAKNEADLPRLRNEFASRVRTIPLPDPKMYKRLEAALETPFESYAAELFPRSLRRYRDKAVLMMQGLLVALAVLFMTLPALNLITLNLSRILERASEIGVRKAFGAPRRSLVGQFVLENVVLTLIGGLCAFVLAIGALALLNRSGLIPHAHFVMNWRVFGYAMLTAVFFGLLSGAYPAWRMSRLDPVTALRGGAA
jgi:putative ABC transport system permease protein